jgi:uncharacterized protein
MRRSPKLASLLVATVIAAGLWVLPSEAQRPDAARMAAARDLVEATGGVAMAEKAIDEMLAGIINSMRQSNPGAAGDFERVMRTILSPSSPKVKAYLQEIMDVTVNLYAEKFTVEEMKELAAFHRSPVGKKFQNVVPEAMSRMAPAMMKFQTGIMPDVQGAMQGGGRK